MRYVYACALRWSDLDAYGHVNNARFLTLYEEARVALMFTAAARRGLRSFADGVVIARHEIDYLRPVDYPLVPPVPGAAVAAPAGGQSAEPAGGSAVPAGGASVQPAGGSAVPAGGASVQPAGGEAGAEAPVVGSAGPPATGPAVRIEMWVAELRPSRFALAYELYAAGGLASRARSVCVPYDLAAGRPRRLSPAEREFLLPWCAG